MVGEDSSQSAYSKPSHFLWNENGFLSWKILTKSLLQNFQESHHQTEFGGGREMPGAPRPHVPFGVSFSCNRFSNAAMLCREDHQFSQQHRASCGPYGNGFIGSLFLLEKTFKSSRAKLWSYTCNFTFWARGIYSSTKGKKRFRSWWTGEAPKTKQQPLVLFFFFFSKIGLWLQSCRKICLKGCMPNAFQYSVFVKFAVMAAEKNIVLQANSPYKRIPLSASFIFLLQLWKCSKSWKGAVMQKLQRHLSCSQDMSVVRNSTVGQKFSQFY